MISTEHIIASDIDIGSDSTYSSSFLVPLDVIMTSNLLFRRLTSGITFDTKKFSKEASKFGLTKPDTDVKLEEKGHPVLPSIEDVKREIKEKLEKEKQLHVSDDDENDITVLGNIKNTSEKKKKKKTKTKVKEAYEEKLNQFRNANNIHVSGTDVPEPISEWPMLTEKWNMSEQVVSCITYPRPSAIQMQTIPVMMAGRELLACAPTGSGKTAAFLLPLIHQLREPRNGGYRAVVVVPTKELAVQICNECSALCAKNGLRAHMLSKVKADKKVN